VGYTLGVLAAVSVYLLGAGVILAALVFWLGGAIATIACAAISVYGRVKLDAVARSRGTAELPAIAPSE
jgi:hypothetical protein